jgi:hypothetical protein
MSEFEKHIGRIRKVDLGFQQPDEWAKKECEKRGITLSDYDSYVRALVNYYYPPQFVEIKGELYEIVKRSMIDYDDSFCVIISKNEQESVFITEFDNGGTSLIEMLEEPKERIWL